MKVAVCLLMMAVACAVAYPQREGAAYTNEAIKQAQNTYLIPKDAQIQKVTRLQKLFNNFMERRIMHLQNSKRLFPIQLASKLH